MKQAKVMDSPDKALAVAGDLDRAGGAISQRFAFVALPDGRAIYVGFARSSPAATRTPQPLKIDLVARLAF